MLDQVLAIAEVNPDYDLSLMRPGRSLDELTAALLAGLGPVMDDERPDWVVVQGDTTTAMVAALLCAYYRKLPVCHVEAGLRSGDVHGPWPEEINRKIIGGIAALHCLPRATASAALRREGVDPAAIHLTGNTAIDALQWVSARIEHEPMLAVRVAGLEARFSGRRIIGVTSHSVENFGAGMEAVASAFHRIAQLHGADFPGPFRP